MNILIVDDSRLSRSYVKKTLTLTPNAVTNIFEVENGNEALKFLESGTVGCMFLDLNMPEMTGVELVENMFHKGLLGKVEIVVTSSLVERHRADLEERGVKYFLKKPFSPESLAEIAELIQRKQI